MAQTPTDILTRAGDILQDQTNVRWAQAELLRYLNDGRRELAIHRPDIYSTTATVELILGSKQTIPTDGNRFLDAVRNVTVAGVVGRAVRIVEREILDAQLPDWHTETSSTSLKHFMFDERSPKTFYVYPPAVAGHKLEIVYSKSPTDIASGDLNSTSILANEDIYSGVLLDYILYRAFSKDSEYAGNMQRAAVHYQMFANSLGIGNRRRISTSPNVANLDGTPPKNAQLEAA
jgi:hypothetical protein